MEVSIAERLRFGSTRLSEIMLAYYPTSESQDPSAFEIFYLVEDRGKRASKAY